MALRLFEILLKLYKYTLGAFFGERCRFHPSCSDYALECVRTHGFPKGIFFSVRRILSCHPWSTKSHFDPVPKP